MDCAGGPLSIVRQGRRNGYIPLVLPLHFSRRQFEQFAKIIAQGYRAAKKTPRDATARSSAMLRVARLRTEVSALKRALAAVRKGKGDPCEVRRLQSQLASRDQTITELRREIARLSKGRPHVWESPERPFIRSRVRRQAAQDAKELRKG
jgi:hypothetical protein